MRKITVTLTRYAEPDALLREVLDSATSQVGVTGEVLLIEQREAGSVDEREYASANLPLRIIRSALGGLSEARNLSLEQARHDLIMFLDADAVAAPDWAVRLAEALDSSGVAIAGSRIVPRWTGKEPFLAGARVVRDQFSLLDLGSGKLPYPRVVGAAFGVDRAKIGALRFDKALGRRGGRLYGGEDSDFCQRASAAGCMIVYQGAACVEHIVAPERMRLRWIVKRLVFAGQGRGRLGGKPSPSGSPGLVDWLTLPITLPPYALGWLWGQLSAGKRS